MRTCSIILFFFPATLFILILVNPANGRDDHALRTFTTNDGLAHNFVQSICQDKTGFIWFATWDGLSRFDGTEFKNYYSNPKDTASLPFFCLDKVLVDPSGDVLVYCLDRSLSIYNRVLDRFENLSVNGIYCSVSGIEIDKKGTTWLTLTDKDAILRKKRGDKKFSVFRVVDDNYQSFDSKLIRFITIDNTGGIWLYRMNPEGINIHKGIQVNDTLIRLENIKPLLLNKQKSFSLHNADQLEIYCSRKGNYWLFSKNGLFLFNEKQNEFQPFTGKIEPEEFSGQPWFKWIDDQTGINVIDTKNKSHFTIKPEQGQYFETCFIDQQQTVWGGTVAPGKGKIGLNRYIKIPQYFKHYLTDNNDNNDFKHVTPVLKDRFGDIWAGTNEKGFIYQVKPTGKVNKIRFLDHPGKDGYPIPSSMVEDSTGIWIGCFRKYLIHYDFKTRKFTSRISSPLINDHIPYRLEIHNILRSKNAIIINAGDSLYHFDIKTNELKFEFSTFEKLPLFTLVSDGNDGYWLGSFSARLFHLNAGFRIDTTFRFLNRDEIVQHIVPGDNNDLWIALQGAGLGHQNLNTGKSEFFTTTNGLYNNTVYSILKDKKGRLWISHDKGISCFDPKTQRFRNFGTEDGIQIDEFSGDSYFQAPDGEMFFGGVNGIVSFYPEEITKLEQPVSPLIITGINVSGITRHFNKPVDELDSVVLKKGDNNFNISFACLNFKDDLKVKYRNRLIGVSDEWKETNQKNRDIGYFNLLPGNYQLQIEASDKNGNWDTTKSLMITIPFRIYERLWFKLFIALLLLTALSGMIFIYNKQLRVRARQEQEELRLEALRNQMNPHFIFNSLNSINYFISRNDRLSANHYIADFSRLIRSFLSNLSNEFILLETEINLLKDYLKLESLRFGDKFTYDLTVDNLGDLKSWQVFPGIIQPFIENAIWHGISGLENRMGHIDIRFVIKGPALIQCVIDDDGIGRKLAGSFQNEYPRRNSRGIGIILERLNLHNKHRNMNYQVVVNDLYDDRRETGTRVIVDLPVIRI